MERLALPPAVRGALHKLLLGDRSRDWLMRSVALLMWSDWQTGYCIEGECKDAESELLRKLACAQVIACWAAMMQKNMESALLHLQRATQTLGMVPLGDKHHADLVAQVKTVRETYYRQLALASARKD